MRGITRNPALVLLFSFISCGIYFLYWLYVTSNDLKNYLDDNTINPGVDLLLSILCFPYVIYWMYKYSKLVTEAQVRAGISPAEDNSIVCVILPFFGLAIVSAMIIQNSINRVWES